MSLRYFARDFVDWLRCNVDGHISLYKMPDFPDYVKEKVERVKGIKEADLPIQTPELKAEYSAPRFDSQNVRMVFSQMKNLSDTQAMDERLWAYMTHIEAWEYMYNRWGIESTNAKDKSNFILERYFIKTSNSRWLIRNGVARLWWFGRLTYTDEHQWELTDILLNLQDVQASLLERSYGKNPKILHSALRIIAEDGGRLEENLLNMYGEKKKGYQQFGKYLGLLGGTTLFDTLTVSDIESCIRKKFLT